MRPILAGVVLVAFSVGIVDAWDDDAPAPPSVTPDTDKRLARWSDSPFQKIGLFTYFRNNGGGYTFLQDDRLEFYSLPNVPEPQTVKYAEVVLVSVNGKVVRQFVSHSQTLGTIGTVRHPFGGQTFFRTQMKQVGKASYRDDKAIATWSRESAHDKFRFSITSDGHETRLKLKSIISVLERAEHAR
jgi:hypothetical protein